MFVEWGECVFDLLVGEAVEWGDFGAKLCDVCPEFSEWCVGGEMQVLAQPAKDNGFFEGKVCPMCLIEAGFPHPCDAPFLEPPNGFWFAYVHCVSPVECDGVRLADFALLCKRVASTIIAAFSLDWIGSQGARRWPGYGLHFFCREWQVFRMS